MVREGAVVVDHLPPFKHFAAVSRAQHLVIAEQRRLSAIFPVNVFNTDTIEHTALIGCGGAVG